MADIVCCNPKACIPKTDRRSRNAFFNFAKAEKFIRKNRKASEAMKEAAQKWKSLSDREKECYANQAEAVPCFPLTKDKRMNRILRLLQPETNGNHQLDSRKIMKVRKTINNWMKHVYNEVVRM